MFGVTTSDDYRPVTWMGRYPVDVTTILVGLHVICAIATALVVGFIHGGMKPGSREEPRTRLYAEQQFKDGAIQVLVATEAAGEGINLQSCHIMFNYDIPWNPNRLEQRMGRIHRYGQIYDCLIFNFVATNTIEGRILERLWDKLQEIRNALDDDAVFNVVGEILPAAQLERVLRDYYAGKMGEADLEDRVLRDVSEDRFRNICQTRLKDLLPRSSILKCSSSVEPEPRSGESFPRPSRASSLKRRRSCLSRCSRRLQSELRQALGDLGLKDAVHIETG